MRKKENETERRVENKNNSNNKKTNFSFCFWELEADPPRLDHQNEPVCP